MEGRRLRVVLVVGSHSWGKTAYAGAVVDRALGAGLRVGGYLTEAEWDGPLKARYRLRAAAGEGGAILLGARRPGPGLDVPVGRWHLSGRALAAADRLLERGAGADLVVVDEVGPLELRGRGVWPGVRRLLAREDGILLLTARPSVAVRLQPIIRALAGIRPILVGEDPRQTAPAGTRTLDVERTRERHAALEEDHHRRQRDHRAGERAVSGVGRATAPGRVAGDPD